MLIMACPNHFHVPSKYGIEYFDVLGNETIFVVFPRA